MHTAGKVLLILGGIITVIGIVYGCGAASADFDPTEKRNSGTSVHSLQVICSMDIVW